MATIIKAAIDVLGLGLLEELADAIVAALRALAESVRIAVAG